MCACVHVSDDFVCPFECLRVRLCVYMCVCIYISACVCMIVRVCVSVLVNDYVGALECSSACVSTRVCVHVSPFV